MRFLPSNKPKPVMAPQDACKYLDVNKIANSIEKAHKTLLLCKRIGNVEAVATWERILAALRHRWNEAMIQVVTDGRYNFE